MRIWLRNDYKTACLRKVSRRYTYVDAYFIICAFFAIEPSSIASVQFVSGPNPESAQGLSRGLQVTFLLSFSFSLNSC